MKEILLHCTKCGHNQKAYHLENSPTVTKCVKCGEEMEQVASELGDEGKSCPDCGKILNADDVLCTSCGYNFMTGKKMDGIGAQIKKKENKRSFMAPLIKIGLLIIIAGAVWYFGINKIIVMLKLHKSNYAFEELRFDGALKELKHPSLFGSAQVKDFVRLREKQIDLEKKEKTAEKNIRSNTIIFRLIDSMTAPINLMYLKFEISNKSSSPLKINEKFFYLRSLTGHGNVALARDKNPEVNFPPLTLNPGESLKASICVKYLPAIRLDPESGKYEVLFIVFNDGVHYLQEKINPVSIWVLTSKDVFEKWKAQISPKKST